MTWEEIIRRYPHQWVIFEVERPAVPAAQGVLLRVLEAGCAPHTILNRCNELAHGEVLRTVHFAHTTWAAPRQDLPLRTLPGGTGIAV